MTLLQTVWSDIANLQLRVWLEERLERNEPEVLKGI